MLVVPKQYNIKSNEGTNWFLTTFRYSETDVRISISNTPLFQNKSVFLVLEYTKTTDQATISIPQAVSRNEVFSTIAAT